MANRLTGNTVAQEMGHPANPERFNRHLDAVMGPAEKSLDQQTMSEHIGQ